MKRYFHLTDNIIDKKISEYINDLEFAKRKSVNAQINQVIQFFANNFTDGNQNKALDLLDEQNSPMRKKDAVILYYLAGLLTMIGFLIVCLAIIPQDPEDPHFYDET